MIHYLFCFYEIFDTRFITMDAFGQVDGWGMQLGKGIHYITLHYRGIKAGIVLLLFTSGSLVFFLLGGKKGRETNQKESKGVDNYIACI